MFSHFILEAPIGIGEPRPKNSLLDCFCLISFGTSFSIPLYLLEIKKDITSNTVISSNMEAPIGIEPMNQSFADSCLTAWLRRHIIKNVWSR